MNASNSPCLTCTKVPIPGDCDNKNCTLWRKWFVKSWDAIRAYPRESVERAATKPMGVPLGGNHYAHPHRVREYRNNKPCANCYAKDFCKSPCKILISWTQEGGKQ